MPGKDNEENGLKLQPWEIAVIIVSSVFLAAGLAFFSFTMWQHYAEGGSSKRTPMASTGPVASAGPMASTAPMASTVPAVSATPGSPNIAKVLSLLGL